MELRPVVCVWRFDKTHNATFQKPTENIYVWVFNYTEATVGTWHFVMHRLKCFSWWSYLLIYTQPVHIADVIVYELVFCPMWIVLLRETSSSLLHCLSACLFMTVLLLSAVSVLWQYHKLWLYIACHVKWYLPLILLLMLWETERRLCSLIILVTFYIFFFWKLTPRASMQF